MGAYNKFDLTGKSAVVTGGATGIGYNITRALVTSGADVLICARRADALRTAMKQLNQDPDAKGEVFFETVDLSDRKSIESFAQYSVDLLGGVDIFVGNAGQDILSTIDGMLDESIDQTIQVNFSSNVALFRSYLPYMRKQRWGRVIFSSSASSICSSATDGMSVYGASKAALNAFTRAAAAEAGRDNITVNSLILGVFMTKMLADVVESAGEGFVDTYKVMTSLGRLAACEEIEGLIQLLASNAGSYITAASIAIDGGLTSMLKANPISE